MDFDQLNLAIGLGFATRVEQHVDDLNSSVFTHAPESEIHQNFARARSACSALTSPRIFAEIQAGARVKIRQKRQLADERIIPNT